VYWAGGQHKQRIIAAVHTGKSRNGRSSLIGCIFVLSWKERTWKFTQFLAHFPYFEKIKVGL
jgi:hypothetical protein